MDGGFDTGMQDAAIQFNSYEEYLDHHITQTDMFYLEDVDLARQLVELGYRGNGEVLRREDFEARKDAAEQARLQKLRSKPKKLYSVGKAVEGHPLLMALAQREEPVRNGKLATIIFIRDYNAKGQEVSAYIDFGQRLKTEDLDPIFDCKKKLLPRPSDLSFYNWETQTSTSTATPNFQVVADHEEGLLFKNKRDRKVINVDPKAKPGDNSVRTELNDPEYKQIVLFDHITRRRS